MPSDKVGAFLGDIPDLFYDFVAYFLSGLYFTLGIYYIFELNTDQNIGILFSSNIMEQDLFRIITLFGIVYIAGHLLTSFSSYIIGKFPIYIVNLHESKSKRKKRIEKYSIWKKRTRYLQIYRPDIASHTSKTKTRWIFSRNLALASFVILTISIFQKNTSILFIILFISFYIDNLIKKNWFDDYVNYLYKKIKKLYKNHTT